MKQKVLQQVPPKLELVNVGLRPGPDSDILSAKNDLTISFLIPMFHYLRDNALNWK